MRARSLLAAVIVSLSACSENASTPTESKAYSDGLSSADGPCVNAATITLLPGISTAPRNAVRATRFQIHNECNNTSSSWETTASVSGIPSGTMVSASASPGIVTLAGGATDTVVVTFTTGNVAGKGFVTLSATSRGTGPIVTISKTRAIQVGP